jgi:hypothetical protein
VQHNRDRDERGNGKRDRPARLDGAHVSDRVGWFADANWIRATHIHHPPDIA